MSQCLLVGVPLEWRSVCSSAYLTFGFDTAGTLTATLTTSTRVRLKYRKSPWNLSESTYVGTKTYVGTEWIGRRVCITLLKGWVTHIESAVSQSLFCTYASYAFAVDQT